MVLQSVEERESKLVRAWVGEAATNAGCGNGQTVAIVEQSCDGRLLTGSTGIVFIAWHIVSRQTFHVARIEIVFNSGDRAGTAGKPGCVQTVARLR